MHPLSMQFQSTIVLKLFYFPSNCLCSPSDCFFSQLSSNLFISHSNMLISLFMECQAKLVLAFLSIQPIQPKYFPWFQPIYFPCFPHLPAPFLFSISLYFSIRLSFQEIFFVTLLITLCFLLNKARFPSMYSLLFFISFIEIFSLFFFPLLFFSFLFFFFFFFSFFLFLFCFFLF